MMRFLVLSDSHGKRDAVRTALLRTHTHRFPIDAVLFLGDGVSDLDSTVEGNIACFSVRGNCDFYPVTAQKEEILTFEGHRLFLAHGDQFSVAYGRERIAQYAYLRGADIVLYGHTHVPEETYLPTGSMLGDTVNDYPMYILNPGSIGAPRGGSTAGYGVLELSDRGVLWSRAEI